MRGFTLMSKAFKGSRGFTLIELMVAIAIIAMLGTIGIYAASAVLTSNRNTQRISDLKLIQVALQQYYSDRGYYPCNAAAGCSNKLNLSQGGRITNCTGRSSAESCTADMVYLSAIPSDPRSVANNAVAYCYDAQISRDNPDHSCNNSSSSTQCKYYHLYAVMEPEGGTNITCQNGGTPNNMLNYMVEPL